jgi:(p)ppGpp synthase/HD superfamily hydrolase
MDNMYRLFVRTEREQQRYLYGNIVDDSDFMISDVNETDPRDTYKEKIKIFLRNGNKLSIDKGATVLDVAFYIHPQTGLHFSYAMLDESKTQLPCHTRLNEGDTITIVTDEDAWPEIAWFKYVNTVRAKHELVKYFQKKLAAGAGTQSS